MSAIVLPDDVSPRSGLTRAEDSIIKDTASIVRKFNRLPNKTTADLQVVMKAITDIQCIIGTNALARLFPGYWITPGIASDSEEDTNLA